MNLRQAAFPTAEDGGWHPEVIKTAIRVRGTTLSKLALDHGLPESSCRVALIRPHPEADKVISKFLAVPLCELWPSRYDDDGNAIRHEREEPTQDRDPAHRLISGAA